MTVQPSIGEQLVGAYFRLIERCEVVSYNQRSREDGDQMELDVLGVRSEYGEQTVFACEVVTHLHGLNYSGTPSNDRWEKYGNDQYQYTLERILEKFTTDYHYVTEVFDDADSYIFQLWSPRVSKGHLTDGLETLKRDFERDFDSTLDLVVNEDYTQKINELQEMASSTRKDYGETGFRVLQILENLR